MALTKVYTAGELEKLQADNASANLKVVVDDVSAQFFGRNVKNLADRAIKYLTEFKAAFHDRLGLVINEKKTVIVADDGPVADALRKFLHGTDIKVESTTKLLGVGVATHTASGRQVPRTRYAECRSRRGRCSRIRMAARRGGSTCSRDR